ncbi:MAG: DNA polymerase III subunit delta [Desulfuromonadaceae bacterium]|nr:DNA polymerase III subunit delta [Desulfuromonadaceae bacterium]
MTPAQLYQAIVSRKLPPLIYLYGEEAFLLDEALHGLIGAAVSADDQDFNLDQFSAKEQSAEQIVECARTFPVFADRRCVVVRDAHLLTADQLGFLLPYVEDPSPECCVIFCGDKIDQRKKFFNSFKKTGELVEFKKIYPNQVPAFVQGRARSFQRRFTEDGLQLFCRRVGAHLGEIASELDKLISYCGDSALIDVDSVAQVVSDTRVDSVFDLTDAIGAQELSRALQLLERLIQDGEAPLKLLSMITRHFRQLWKIKAAQEQNLSKGELCQAVGVSPYFVESLLRQSRLFRLQDFPAAFGLFLQMDLAMKSSGSHPEASLQQGVVALCRLATK